MRIGLPSQLQLRSSLPMLRVCVLLAAARAFRPPEWPAGERDALPPLGLNASWLADRVAGGQTFVARAGPLGDRAAELAFLRSHLLAPFHKHAATATATTAALALKGGDGSRAPAPAPAGVVGGLLAGLGEKHHAVVETPLEARLSVVARLEKLFDGDAMDSRVDVLTRRLQDDARWRACIRASWLSRCSSAWPSAAAPRRRRRPCPAAARRRRRT